MAATTVIVLVAAFVVVLIAVAALVIAVRATNRRRPEAALPSGTAGTGAASAALGGSASGVGSGVGSGRPAGEAAAAAAASELITKAERDAADLLDRAEREASALRERVERSAEQVRQRADAEASTRVSQAEVEARLAAQEARAGLESDLRAMRADLDAREERFINRDARMAEREERLDADHERLEARERELSALADDLRTREEALRDLEEERRLVLERTAGLTAADAKAELVRAMENQAKRDAVVIVRDIEAEAKSEGEDRARKIVTLAIQRVASQQTSESVVSVLHLPGDEMKGRIIGREGRNIRTFEQVTGVNVIIDDTPEAVLLSCFDPVRREVGRLTLEALVLDGRIHPQRIEEQYEKSKVEVEALCVRAGEDALVEVGITDMHPELITLLGRLRYRTSYGQNVLKHLIEAAHLAGVMAAELRLPREIAKRGTLLHDLGKALTHEVEGSHALIGAEIARKYGEHEEVVHAIEAHHNEVEPRSVEAVLTQAADAISGGRPGARRESLEAYVQRLERIEQIAVEKEGVDKVFAMQAGREVRVMVLPDRVDDIQAQVLARDIAKQIEEELTYPGQIRVTVVRESRATETAR